MTGGRGEIIAVGSELVSGLVAESNAGVVARGLLDAGLEVAVITCVGDEPSAMEDALRRAVARSAFVVVTGGLGPTDDDLTAQVAAAALGRELIFDPEFLSHVEDYFRGRGLDAGTGMRKLARIPEGAYFLDPGGRTCGFYLEQEDRLVFFLPGVPSEVGRLVTERLLPLLAEKTCPPQAVVRRRVLKVFGLEEFDIGKLTEGFDHQGVAFSYLPVFPGHQLVLTAKGVDAAEAERRLAAVGDAVRGRLGEGVYGEGEDTLAAVVGSLLREAGRTLAVAESCTGGLIGHLITEVAGSSKYFDRGLVTYSNRAKMELLGVPEDVPRSFGAVSAECAAAMASGLRERARSGLALSVTGIAGPGGGSEAKPVGTVWFGLADEQGTRTRVACFEGGRSEIKTAAAWTALDWLRRRLLPNLRLRFP
ncbi:MAG: CinA family nicotinamide mononucleotide deamidase-related protein [Pseudomonadota bacterium]